LPTIQLLIKLSKVFNLSKLSSVYLMSSIQSSHCFLALLQFNHWLYYLFSKILLDNFGHFRHNPSSLLKNQTSVLL